MPLIASCLDSLIQSELLKQNDLSFMKSIGCGGEAMTEEFETKANNFAKNIPKAENKYPKNGF